MSLEKLALWSTLALVVGLLLLAVGYVRRSLACEDGVEKNMVCRCLIPTGWSLFAIAGFATTAGIHAFVSGG